MVEHGCGRDEGPENKCEAVFPEALEKAFIGKEESEKEEDEDERRDAEGDIGMETESKNKTGPEEIEFALSTETSKKEKEGEGEEERCHDRPKSDTGKIDRPIRCCDHKPSYQSGKRTVEEFLAQEIESQDGTGTKENREEFESNNIVPKEPDRERLKVDKQTFTTEIGRVEEFKMFGFERVESVDAIGSFIGVETNRERFKMRDTETGGESQKKSEKNIFQEVRSEMLSHTF